MAPTTQELINNAKLVDAALAGTQIQKNAAIAAAVKLGSVEATPGLHPSKLSLDDPTADPFGGNINNRNVAERIAKADRRIFTNTSRPIHTGDPAKAAADIARSKAITPDPIIEPEQDAEPVKVAPSPGSPAALKAVTPEAPAGGPPAWKPNA